MLALNVFLPQIADSVDEGIGSSSPSRSENDAEDSKRELSKLRRELVQERELRMILEQQVRNLESRLYHLDNASDTADQINLQYHSGTEDPGKCSMSIINLGHESGLGSPQSQISSQDVESGNEMSLSPDLTSSEIPEDLSGKNSAILLRCVDELSFTDVTTIPGLLLSTNHLNVSSCTEEPQQPASFEANRSRQNLDTIVEAIKHVEGVDIFHADPKPVESELSLSMEEKASLLEEQYEEQIQHVSHSLTDRDFSFQHQIIRNAPLTQSRPGVIVSNLS